MSDPLRVVAAAVVDGDRVLAARRSRPAALSGGWEFAGGKVEDGETDAEALARELREELGVDADVGVELGVARDARIELHLYRVSVRTGVPAAGDDHDELRWVGVDELTTLGWLPIDRDLLPVVRDVLSDGSGERLGEH